MSILVQFDMDCGGRREDYEDMNISFEYIPTRRSEPVVVTETNENSSIGTLPVGDSISLLISLTKDIETVRDTSSIVRILRTSKKICIPPRSGMYVSTNARILRENRVPYPSFSWYWYMKISELSLHWLSQESSKWLTVKTGILSPFKSGFLKVWLFNKSDDSIVIAEQTAIAQLETGVYDYPAC